MLCCNNIQLPSNVHVEGVEPPTFGTSCRRLCQLGYTCIAPKRVVLVEGLEPPDPKEVDYSHRRFQLRVTPACCYVRAAGRSVAVTVRTRCPSGHGVGGYSVAPPRARCTTYPMRDPHTSHPVTWEFKLQTLFGNGVSVDGANAISLCSSQWSAPVMGAAVHSTEAYAALTLRNGICRFRRRTFSVVLR